MHYDNWHFGNKLSVSDRILPKVMDSYETNLSVYLNESIGTLEHRLIKHYSQNSNQSEKNVKII